jgi:hypothetical protein
VKKILQICAMFAFPPLMIFFAGLPVQAQTPRLVYSNSLAASGQPGNNFKIVYGGAMGTGSLAKNLITIRVTSPNGSTVSSISDNLSDTYTLGASVNSGSGGWVTSLYYLAGAPAGITQITVNYSSAVADWHGAVQEYSGVATSSPVDGTCSNHSTPVGCSSAITTTAANDLVVATTIGLGATIEWNRLSPTGTIAPGGSFFLDSADTQTSTADEEFVQTSPGSVTPSFSIAGSSQSFNIVGAAFKAASAGSNPTGMYILHEQHIQIGGSAPTSFNDYFVSSGNLVVADTDTGQTFTTNSIDSCSPSNSWTTKTEGSFWPYFFYLTSTASFSTNLHCTIHSSNTGDNEIMVVYDVAGAAASPLDVLSSSLCQGNNGFVSCTIPPSKGPGIVFGAANDGTGPVTQVGANGTAGAIFDNTPYSQETDTGQLNNGDAWQHLFYTTPATITYTWTMQISSSYMETSAIAFDAASQGSQGAPAPPPNVEATAH